MKNINGVMLEYFTEFTDGKGNFNSKKSINNNTQNPLESGQEFFGEWEKNDFSYVSIFCETDTTGVLYFDFSEDGVNYYTVPTTGYKINAISPANYLNRKDSQYFRVRFENSSQTNQTFLRLFTYFSNSGTITNSLASNISQDATSLFVRPYLSEIDLSLGKFQGIKENYITGSVFSMDSPDAPFDIWYPASDDVSNLSLSKTFPSVAGNLYVASTNVNDTGLISIKYINGLGRETISNISLTGQTPVQITADALDCNYAYVLDGTVLGAISIASTATFSGGVPTDITKLLAYIPQGLGQTQQAMDTVPSDKRRIIKEISIVRSRALVGGAASALILFQTRTDNQNWITKKIFDITSGSLINRVSGLILEPFTQMKFVCASLTESDSNINCEIAFQDITI